MRHLLAALVCSLFVAACSTSSGSLIEDAARSERRQAGTTDQEPLEAQEDAPEYQPDYYAVNRHEHAGAAGLEILSDPEGAAIYLDGRFVGTTPALLTEVPQGRYRLRLEKESYYSYTAWIAFFGERAVYDIALQRITGFLRVEVSPPQASLAIDGEQYTPDRVYELPVGSHTVRVRAFGYQEQTRVVTVRERQLAELSVALPEAEFAVLDFRASRGRFNPGNPGVLGEVSFGFEVTTYGHGAVTIRNESGEEVYRRELPSFTTFEQSFSWNGRTPAGAPLPDGPYTVQLEATGQRAGRTVQERVVVTVSSTLVVSYRSLWSGGAGLLYAPTAEVLPGRSWQFSTLFMAHAQRDEEGTTVRVPVALGTRWGLGSPQGDNRWELDVELGSIIGYSEAGGSESFTYPFLASAALRGQLARPQGEPGLGAALQAKLAYVGVSTDTLANATGFSLGVPALMRLGSVSLLLEPELTVGPFRVSSDPDDSRQAGFYLWGYGRAGLLVDLGALTAGLSVAARTTPFSEGFAFDLPVQAGAELHWLIPGTHLVLSGALAGEFSSPTSYYLQGGGGFGLLY